MFKKINGSQKKYATLVTFIVLFAVIGAILLILTKASTNSFNIEAESGSSKTGGVRVMTGTQVSGGSYIEFGSLKKPLRGLMFRSGTPPQDIKHADGTPVLNHSVVNLDWAELEAKDQTFNETAFATINQYTSKGIGVRLRIMSGVHAPRFVKALGGSPVSGNNFSSASMGTIRYIDCSSEGGIAIWNSVDDQGGCVPRFWTSEYLKQYRELMQEIARRYDTTDEGKLVLEVVDSACMTLYAEPFYRSHKSDLSNMRLYQAGLTPAADKACHQSAIDIHNDTFKNTRTSIAFSNWELLTNSPDNQYRVSTLEGLSEAKKFVAAARNTMGDKLTVQNNGLGDNAAEGCPTPTNSIFCILKDFAQPKGYQTETWVKLQSNQNGLFAAIDNGLRTGASFIELPGIPKSSDGQPGIYSINVDRLRDYDLRLEANAPK